MVSPSEDALGESMVSPGWDTVGEGGGLMVSPGWDTVGEGGGLIVSLGWDTVGGGGGGLMVLPGGFICGRDGGLGHGQTAKTIKLAMKTKKSTTNTSMIY